MSNDSLYDAIEVDPIDVLFDKIHKSRGGEMLLIHISHFGKKGPTVRVCSALDKNESILAKILPALVENILDE
jgi:hypothetical protein